MREWYEHGLGWATLPGEPVRISTGLRFDVLDVPAEAGFAALRHLAPDTPVTLRGERVGLLVAAGSADELPGLLDWLDWGRLELGLTTVGRGGHIEAPRPWPHGASPDGPRSGRAGRHIEVSSSRPGRGGRASAVERPTVPGARRSPPSGPVDTGAPLRPSSPDGAGPQGAAVWLRPPEPGCEVEPSLPTLSALGGGGSAPDLVRLVDTVATQCHRIRLRRLSAQAFAFS